MTIGHVYKVVTNMDYLGQNCQNAWWFIHQSGGGSAVAQELADALHTEFYENIVLVCNVGLQVLSTLVIDYNDGIDTGENNDVISGEVAGTPMPSYVTYNISWNRAGAGRNYPQKRIPGVDESLTAGNNLNPTVSSTIAPIADAVCLLELPSGANMQMFTLNPPIEIGQPIGPGNKVQFPDAFRSVKLGIQRSRKA